MPTPPDDPSRGGWSDPGSYAHPGEPDAPDGRPRGADGVPRYTVGALLGRGGMGAVHAARDATFGRDVALKAVAPERAYDAGAAARLTREAAITSRLDHPGIVSVHDAGQLPDGRPFYTMRLVRGRTLGRAAAEATGPEGWRTLVRHVLAAAEAVGAAHAAGVVHRDLKPANILLGAHGETQVVDWGLATPTPAAAPRWADLPARAATGSVGTAPYTSPEQARGEPPDPRDDVWSLGVTLAELVGPGPPAELAAIVARATAAAPTDRYPDASAFADDLLRWFEGRRVAAHAYTAGELLRRTIAAYRLPLAVGAVGLLASAVAVGVGWWQTTRSLDRALTAEADARAALADLRLDQAVAAGRAGDRERAERLAVGVLGTREDPLARGVLAAFGRAERPALLHDGPGPACAWSALPDGGAWVACGGAERVARWQDGREVWAVALPSVGGAVRGDRVLLWDGAGETVALDAETGAEVERWPLRLTASVPLAPPRIPWAGEGVVAASECATTVQVAASAGGRVAAVCGDGTLLLGDAQGLTRAPTEAHGDHVATALGFAPDGRLVLGTLRGRLLVLSETGALLASGETGLGAIQSLRVSPDGRHAALGGTAGGVGLWRLDTAALVGEIPAARPRAFAFAGEGLRVHEGRVHDGRVHDGRVGDGRVDDGRLRDWRLPAGAPSIVRVAGGLSDLSASADGARLALAGADGVVTTVDLRDGHAERSALGDRVVKAVAFGPGGLLVSGMAAPWLAALDGRAATRFTTARPLRRLAWLPDGAIVGADLHGGLYRWERPDAPPAILAQERTFADLERDGAELVALDVRGRVDRLDGSTLRAVATVPGARAVALRGERLVVTTPDGVEVRDAAGVRVLAAPDATLLDVALSPDGGRVAAAGLDGRVRVWDAVTGEVLGVLPGHTERVVAVEFLPDGDLASASWDKTARVWSLDALVRPTAALADEVEAAWGRSPE